MALSLSTVISDLKASVGKTVADKFVLPGDADWHRMLAAALVDMQAKRPITQLGQVNLHPLQERYAVPYADFASLKVHLWASPARTPQPWEPGYPGAVPRVGAQWSGAAWFLVFDPAPSMRQIAAWGDVFPFWYFARHSLADGASTLSEDDKPLLLLRAQVETMRELAMRNVATPVAMRDGYSSTPRNGTPAALFEVLLEQFQQAR